MKRLLFLMLALLVAGSASAATKVQVMTDGVIDVDRLPTISFFQENDPASPELGQIWWNNATNQLKVAGAAGVYSFTGTLAAWDTTPEAFSFTDVTNATTETVYTSAPITVSGINWPAAISVSGDASAKYSVNNATATAVNGTVASGDSVRAVVASSASDGAAVNATVTIGGVSDAFGVTTAEATEPPPAENGTYLVNEDFEGTGTPSGWVKSVNANVDYTTTPIAGEQSAYLPRNGETESVQYILDEGTGAATQIRFAFKSSVMPLATTPYFVILSGATVVYELKFSEDVAAIKAGTVLSSAISYTFETDTVYFVWVDINPEDKTASFFINTTNTKPGSALASVTGDQASTTVDQFVWTSGGAWSSGGTWYDSIAVLQ